MATAAAASAASSKAGVLSHPRGLYFLFFTEMWERFSYYGMRALLVPYMLNYLLFQPASSSATYKWYTSLVYLTPLLGGFLADRFLGLRTSIVIGGVLMAIGHFLMAFEPLPFFYAALGFLIVGNGFFKPNISTMVGKMYTAQDGRRDGAFTIFYMGINLGAFLAPLICGWLRLTYGPHYGFGAAGIGMVLGLVVFLVGQGTVTADVEAAGNHLSAGSKPTSSTEERAPDVDADAAKPGEGAFAGVLARVFPVVMVGGAIAIAGFYLLQFTRGEAPFTALIMPVAFGGIFVWMALTLLGIKGASRDKSTVIFVLFLAAVLFWMTFEQAGNTLNIWAVTHTELKIGSYEYPAEWFQSVNAVLIFALGLPFAALWSGLAKRGKEPATPLKMMMGLLLVALSFVPMVMGAAAETRTETRIALATLPESVVLGKIDAGRLTYDKDKKELVVRGVLPLFAVNDALARTVDPAYLAQLDAFEKAAKDATDKKPVTFELKNLPQGWVFPLDADEAKRLDVKVAPEADASGKRRASMGKGKLEVAFDASVATFQVKGSLDAPVRGNLIAAGAPAEFRDPVRALEKKSQGARVSAIWLLLSYLVATLGELCLSPVGLSMVTKLAPARFASLFMGVWMLASSVAQYAGGTLGESWGTVTPVSYFQMFVWIGAVGAVLLFLLVKPLKKLMHDVN
jgi:POT family proton-dependent oligopeptide transporter